MWGGITTRSRLQKNVSTLEAANNVPEAPTENPVPETYPTRRLSFSREKEIAKSLAFLSVTSDDKRNVMAVCVEEHINGEGITIRIASNTGDLLAAENGFRRIGGILEQIAREPRSRRIDDVETLFREVIVLDIGQILSRLRSRHVGAIRIRKPAIITQLRDAINDKSVKSTADLNNISQSLQNIFTELEGIPDIKNSTAHAHRLIYEIITHVYAITSTTDLHLLFHDSKLEPPSLRSHLHLAFSKLSRYYSDAYSLVCAARDKEYHVFRTVLVEPFLIDMPPSINQAIRVHAEIQLLFFYEMNTDLPRPRVICASKSACYLCNLFFNLHGGFYVARSHGKLYKTWILPDWLPVPEARHADLGDIATKINADLETRIRNPARRHLDPNESVATLAWNWPPSTASKSSSSVDSTSTVRPRSPLASLQQQGNFSTPTRTPPAQIPSLISPLEPLPPVIPVRDTSSTHPTSSPRPLSPVYEVQHSPRTNHATVTLSQLPYSELITATTPPLYLHLDNPHLTLDFDFSLAAPCRLVLTQGEERVGESGECRFVEVEEIPTAEEMQVACLEGSPREIKFQLRGVSVAVVWGGL